MGPTDECWSSLTCGFSIIGAGPGGLLSSRTITLVVAEIGSANEQGLLADECLFCTVCGVLNLIL